MSSNDAKRMKLDHEIDMAEVPQDHEMIPEPVDIHEMKESEEIPLELEMAVTHMSADIQMEQVTAPPPQVPQPAPVNIQAASEIVHVSDAAGMSVGAEAAIAAAAAAVPVPIPVVDNTSGVAVVHSQQQPVQVPVENSHPSMPPLPGDILVPPLGGHPMQMQVVQPHQDTGPRPAHTLPSTDPAYRRKDKSLGVLCANFMRRYSKMHTDQPSNNPEVTIDEASQSLMVERRRIYDIINILEAIEVVTRKGKNTYNWHGMGQITHTLRKMQKEAFELFPDDVDSNSLKKEEKEANIPTGFAMLLASAEQVDQPMKKGKEKSLGRLSQKFIMLFLVGNETITLEEASDKILGKTELPQAPPDATAEEMLKIRNSNNKMIKTKIRRLYDIANIMASVGLIAKLHSETQHVGSAPRSRPMFKWIYPLSAREILHYVDQTVQQVEGQDYLVPVPGKEVKIGINGVIENTIENTLSPVEPGADSGVAVNATEDSLADTATAVVNAVDAQLAGELEENAAKAAENAVLIADAVVNGDNTHDLEAAQAAVAAVEEQVAMDADATEPFPIHLLDSTPVLSPVEVPIQDPLPSSAQSQALEIHIHDVAEVQAPEEEDGTTIAI